MSRKSISLRKRNGYIYRRPCSAGNEAAYINNVCSVRTVVHEVHSHYETCNNSSEGIVVRSGVQSNICETK